MAPDIDSFAGFGRKALAALPNVREVRSTFVMQTIEELPNLPLPD
ncbi:Lrp/AsnC ligand binding domain-containing protein [Paraburkholderia acidicola]|uniref:Lrp/AsnC ligand binding domain-containing protein n=1 Tax=Paraburkholderia acidicola TaxID=1912599 RepID=A0ABV1LXW4_9BURK